MIIIKNKIAIDTMRTAGHKLAGVFSKLSGKVVEGVNTLELNNFIEAEMISVGLRPECKGYGGYCHATCISLNDVIVHGVPSEKNVLKSGDFVKIDVVGSYSGYCADMTRFYFVGKVKPVVKLLAKTAQIALDSAINISKPGVRLSELSGCVQKIVEDAGFGVVRKFAGHGIGRSIHEDPEVPNFVEGSEMGPILREGMTLAIEPMITQNSIEVRVDSDGWTARTSDGGFAAHVEDTIVIMRNGAEILTRL